MTEYDPQSALPAITALLQAAKAPLEQHFEGAGADLTDAIALLNRITGRFDSLVEELDSASLRDATDELATVARQLPMLVAEMQAQRALCSRVQLMLPPVSAHLQRISAAVQTVRMLASSARIEVAGLGAAAADFSVFTDQIIRLYTDARRGLRQLGQDIAALDRALGGDPSASDASEARNAEAMQRIPGWLGESVAAVDRRRRTAAAAAALIRERAGKAKVLVGNAIVALQVADSTRQRIEHVQETLEATGGLLASGGAAGEPLDPARGRSLTAHVAALQAAQLRQTATDYAADAGRVVSAVQALTADARDICRLGSESGQGEGGFLGEVEENVRQAGGLLDEFSAARAEADRIAGDIAAAVGRLVAQIGTVRELEAELRMLSLNMVLKSGRLGDAGRALRVVSQELRLCADTTSYSADGVAQGLAEVEREAAGLRRGEGALADLGALGQRMRDASQRIAAVGGSIAGSLAGLQSDGESTATTLADAVAQIVAADIGPRLEQAIRRLEALVGPQPLDAGQLAAIAELVPKAFRGGYTMASERAIHEGLDAAAAPQSSVADIDDLLF